MPIDEVDHIPGLDLPKAEQSRLTSLQGEQDDAFARQENGDQPGANEVLLDRTSNTSTLGSNCNNEADQGNDPLFWTLETDSKEGVDTRPRLISGSMKEGAHFIEDTLDSLFWSWPR